MKALCKDAVAAAESKRSTHWVLIKPRSVIHSASGELARAFPSAQHAFLYREPLGSVRSFVGMIGALTGGVLGKTIINRLSAPMYELFLDVREADIGRTARRLRVRT